MKPEVEIIRETTDDRCVKYYINEKKKTIVCTIEDMLLIDEDDRFEYMRKITVRGKAKCMPEDKFDKELGMRIARDRADICYHKVLRDTLSADVNKAVKAFDRFMVGVNAEIWKQTSKINNITAHLNKLLGETE